MLREPRMRMRGRCLYFSIFVDAGGLVISVEERFVDSFVPSGGIIDGSGSGVVKVGKYFGQER